MCVKVWKVKNLLVRRGYVITLIQIVIHYKILNAFEHFWKLKLHVFEILCNKCLQGLLCLSQYPGEFCPAKVAFALLPSGSDRKIVSSLHVHTCLWN